MTTETPDFKDQPEEPNNGKKINLKLLSDLVQGNKTKLNKYIEIYLRNVPDAVESIKKALEAKDYEALHKHIHAFKPQVKMMGIVKLNGFIDTLEKDLKEQTNLESIRERTTFTINSIEESVEILNEILNQTD